MLLISVNNRLRLFYFAYLASLGAFSPFFGLFAKTRGFNEWQVSVLMSLWYGARIFAPSLWNLAVERSQNPIHLLRVGSLICVLATAMFLPALNFVGMVLVMLVFSSIFNALMPQFESITLQYLQATPERYSGIRLWGSLGFLLAVLSFGALFKASSASYLIVSMLPLLGLLIAASWLNDYPSKAIQSAAHAPAVTDSANASERHNLLGNRAFLALLFIAGCNQIAHGPLYVYFGIYLQQHGFDELVVGKLWALAVLCEIIMFASMKAWLGRISPNTLLCISLLIGSVRWAVTGLFPNSLTMLALAQLAHAFTFAAIHAASMRLLSDWLAPQALGRAQGYLYGLSSGLGGVLGALISGLVWKLISPQACFYFAAGFSLLALAVLPLLPRVSRV